MIFNGKFKVWFRRYQFLTPPNPAVAVFRSCSLPRVCGFDWKRPMTMTSKRRKRRMRETIDGLHRVSTTTCCRFETGMWETHASQQWLRHRHLLGWRWRRCCDAGARCCCCCRCGVSASQYRLIEMNRPCINGWFWRMSDVDLVEVSNLTIRGLLRYPFLTTWSLKVQQRPMPQR